MQVRIYFYVHRKMGGGGLINYSSPPPKIIVTLLKYLINNKPKVFFARFYNKRLFFDKFNSKIASIGLKFAQIANFEIKEDFSNIRFFHYFH